MPFGSRIVILDRFFASFISWMGIPGRSFMPFGSRIGIIDRFFVSFVSRMGIPGRSFILFGSWIRIPAGFLILRTCPKSDLYKDRMIFYRDSAALYRVGYVVASRNGSSFLSLMKEKKQKKIKAMIAISFCLVHVVNGRCFVRLGEESAIFAKFLLLRICSKSDLYKDRLIFYHDSAALHGFDHVVASRNGSFFSFLDERKESKENQGDDRHLFLSCTCDPWVMFHSLGREEDYPHRVFAFEKVP